MEKQKSEIFSFLDPSCNVVDATWDMMLELINLGNYNAVVNQDMCGNDVAITGGQTKLMENEKQSSKLVERIKETFKNNWSSDSCIALAKQYPAINANEHTYRAPAILILPNKIMYGDVVWYFGSCLDEALLQFENYPWDNDNLWHFEASDTFDLTVYEDVTDLERLLFEKAYKEETYKEVDVKPTPLDEISDVEKIKALILAKEKEVAAHDRLIEELSTKVLDLRTEITCLTEMLVTK